MTEIKICGITNVEDALCAADCGADAVGFIFHPASPRFIPPEQAKGIADALPEGIARVGVFVNRCAAEVERIAEACGLDFIQLHGDEPPEFCRLFPPGRVIKTVFPRRMDDLQMLAPYKVRAFLIDSRTDGLYGGTGRSADWELAARLREAHPMILAGGLNEGNIHEALSSVAPHAVDINSGIERAPGIKDHERMKRMVEIIRRAVAPGPKVIFAAQRRATGRSAGG
jgi:phosphoribosylanthranilate isomerase